jgi:hypothetical protein
MKAQPGPGTTYRLQFNRDWLIMDSGLLAKEQS